jgi:hypothetical protein
MITTDGVTLSNNHIDDFNSPEAYATPRTDALYNMIQTPELSGASFDVWRNDIQQMEITLNREVILNKILLNDLSITLEAVSQWKQLATELKRFVNKQIDPAGANASLQKYTTLANYTLSTFSL